MARTKGALNKRTRAALHAAKVGELDENGISSPVHYLLGVMRNSKKPDALRIEAAKSVAPYLQPKLSAVEFTDSRPDESLTEAELTERLKDVLREHPELRAQLSIGDTLPASKPGPST
jgi:hypothetical protein